MVVEGDGGVFSIEVGFADDDVANEVVEGGDPNNVDSGGRGRLPVRANNDVVFLSLSGGEGCIPLPNGMNVAGSLVSVYTEVG